MIKGEVKWWGGKGGDSEGHQCKGHMKRKVDSTLKSSWEGRLGGKKTNQTVM